MGSLSGSKSDHRVVTDNLLAEREARMVRTTIPPITHPGPVAVNLPHAARNLSLIVDSSFSIVETSCQSLELVRALLRRKTISKSPVSVLGRKSKIDPAAQKQAMALITSVSFAFLANVDVADQSEFHVFVNAVECGGYKSDAAIR